MIITKSKPFTKEEIKQLRELFGTYIKTVIDVNKRVCSAGMDRHFEGEKILLDQGSKQSDIWGGGIDLETKIIDFNSFINIRPNDNNNSNEILDPCTRQKYEKLSRYFFQVIL
ncbi:DUF5674 family protein [Patescibacteria group bacterium]|nr:DUF5674 family protein [Patescibacteria group bacterium]